MRAHSGFTLVELLMVIVFIAIAVAGIGGMFSTSTAALITTTDEQRIAQFIQECGELVLGTRRDLGFTAVTSSSPTCSGTPASGFTRSMSGNGVITTSSPCPTGANCQSITITVSKGALSSSATIMLVEY